MAITFIDPVEVTPGIGSAWTDVDVSAYVPAGATGVILHIVNTHSSSTYYVGMRKNGSTDNRTGEISKNSHFWATIGVDNGRIFECYVSNITYVDIYLVGYFASEAVFFTNGILKTPTTLSWTDVDISTDTGSDTAIAALFEVSDNITIQFGSRANGSTDTRIAGVRYHNVAIVPVDASEICEIYMDDYNPDSGCWLLGYIKSGATFYTNATDVSLSTTGAWTDLSALPSGAIGGFFEVYGTSNYYFGLRKNGSSEDIYRYNYYHPWAIVECDTSRLIEGKIGSIDEDFFLVGYATGGGAATHNASASITGAATATATGTTGLIHAAAAGVIGAGTATALGQVTRVAQASATGATTVAATARRTTHGAANIGGIATFVASGQITRTAGANIAGTAVATATAQKIAHASASVSGTAAAAATGTKTGEIMVTASAAGQATVTAAGSVIRHAVAVITGTATAAAAGIRTALGTVNVAGAATATGAGVVTRLASAAVQGVATATAAAQKILLGAASIAGLAVASATAILNAATIIRKVSLKGSFVLSVQLAGEFREKVFLAGRFREKVQLRGEV